MQECSPMKPASPLAKTTHCKGLSHHLLAPSPSPISFDPAFQSLELKSLIPSEEYEVGEEA